MNIKVASVSVLEKLFLFESIVLYLSYFFILGEKSSVNFLRIFLIGFILCFLLTFFSVSFSSILSNLSPIVSICSDVITAFLYLESFYSNDLRILEEISAKSLYSSNNSPSLFSSYANFSASFKNFFILSVILF